MSDQKYIDEIRQIWNLVKESFRDSLTETTIDLWFGEIDVLSYDGEEVTLGIASEFKYGIIQNKYIGTIRQKFCELLGFDIRVELKFTGSRVTADQVKDKVLGLNRTLRTSRSRPPCRATNLNIPLKISSSAAPTNLPTRPVWPWQTFRSRDTTPCSSGATAGWGKPT